MKFWKKRATHATGTQQPGAVDIQALLAGQPVTALLVGQSVTGHLMSYWLSCNGVLTCRWQLDTVVVATPSYQPNAAAPKTRDRLAWEGAISAAIATEPPWRPTQEETPFSRSYETASATSPHQLIGAHGTP